MTFTVNIPGEPRGQGRPRFARTTSGVTTYTDSETKGYQNLIRTMANIARVRMIDGPVSIAIVAYFEIPKSASKSRQQEMRQGLTYPTKRPDADNIGKAVLDALNGIAFKDDAQVCELTIRKRWADEPSVRVEIKALVETFAEVAA